MSYVTVLKLLKQGSFHLACGLFLLAMVPLGYAQQQSALKVSLSLPQATMDVAYSGSMNITGGAGPYSITESGTLPAGLAWHNGANGSLLTGTPTANGTFNLTVIVTDTIGEKFVQTGALVVGALRPKPLDAGAIQSVTDVIVIADGATANAAPTVTPSTIPGGKAGAPYGPVFFTNLDTTTPVTFNLLGALPQGMVATPGTNTLELSGTPLVSGSFPIQVQIFDLPYLLHTTTASYTLSIAAPQPLQIVVSSSFNDAPYVGTAITPATFTASGGSGNLSTSVSGALPGGLTLTPGTTLGIPDLVLSGTPTVEGQEEFTIKVTDNVLGTTFSQAYDINAKEPVRYADPSDAPSGTVGQFYYFIASVAGTPPPNYTVKLAGPLPPGLALAYSGSSAILSGTPTLAGSYLMVPEGTDQYGNTEIIGLYTVVIKPAPFVTIAATSAPTAPTYNDANTISFALTGSAPAVPTGSLSIALDGGAAKTYPIVSGAVTLPLGRQAAGTHTLSYSYSGDATYPALAGQTYGFSVAVPPYSVVGAQTSIGSANAANVAVDSKDNVYYPDYYYNKVYKIDTQGNQTVFPTTGINGAQGMRFDANDNLYLCDRQNGRVLMITQAGVQTVLPFTGPAYPRFLSFDVGYKNLYVMDEYYGVYIYNLASQTTQVYNNNISSPHGVTVDAQNNVYYASGNTIFKNGAAFGTVPTQPNGLIFDRAGNLYIAANYALYRMDASGNVTQISDISTNEVGIDSHGILYYPTGQKMLAYTPGPAVWGGRNEAYDNGRPPYQYTTNYSRAFYSTPVGVTLSSVAIPSVGSPYTGDTAPSCLTSTLCGATLSLGAFQPGPQPGYGVATFSDGTKTVTPLYGTGEQIAIGFTPGNTTGIASGIANFGGAANDLNGGVYVSDSVANQVFKVSGGTLTPMAFTGLNAPTQLATDGAGSVYVLDSGSQRILKLDSGGNQTVAFDMSQQGSLLSSTLTSLQSFALDGATNLYLGGASSSGAALIEFYGANGASSIYATPPAVPATLALDALGTLYSADVQGALAKYDHFANRVPVATGLPVFNSMAIEPSGTIYLASNTSPMLTQVSPTGTVVPYQVPGVNLASVVTIDNYGSLSVGDNSTQILTFNDRSTQAYTFGDVALGATSTLHHSVVNVGNQGGMTMSFSGDSFFDIDPTTTTCVTNSTALDPGQSCEIGITYSARYSGPFTGTGAVHATTSQIFFESTSSKLTMTGTGATSVPVANPGGPYTGTVVSAVSFNGLASTDSTGEALTYNWDFGDGTSGTGATPSHTYSAARAYIVKLTVTNTDGVTAFATTTATIGQSYTASLTPASYDFGGVIIDSLSHGLNNSAVQVFTLTNTGTGSFSVGTVQLASEASNSYSASNNCNTLAVGAACTITVTFKPTVTGAISTTLSIKDAAGTQTATITGNGLTSPLEFYSPTGFAFGNVPVGSQVVQMFTITNLANQPTAYSLHRFSTANPPYFSLSGCTSPIAANAKCTVTVTYQPTQVGPQGVEMELDDPDIDTYLIFTGTGIAPLTISPPNFDFGNVTVGSQVSRTFTVANLANQPTAYSVQMSLPSSNPPVIGLSGCNSPIAANATCTLTVDYQPTGTGFSTSTVSLSNAVSVGGISVGTGVPVVTSFTLTATGVAATVARSQVMIVGISSLATFPTDGSTSPTSSTGGGMGAAVDASGNLLSIDMGGSSLTKFTDAGVATGSLTGNGLTNATALAIDGLSTTYVVNSNGTISVFDSSGNAVGTTTIGASSTVTKPASINVDASGSLWMANAGNNTVTEVIGFGAPTQPLVNAVVNATPGTRP